MILHKVNSLGWRWIFAFAGFDFGEADNLTRNPSLGFESCYLFSCMLQGSEHGPIQSSSSRLPAVAMELSASRTRCPTMQALPLLLLFLLAASSMALPVQPAMDRVRWQVEKANRRGPSIGLVMSDVDEATALQSSGYFRPWHVLPFVDLYGRRFHIGSIRGVNVIYALTGQRRLNAAVTVQTLIDVFSVSGIVHYGTAGSSNDSMSFGDVSVPKFVAYTGAWTWKKFRSSKESATELRFGEYNVPNGGENLLGALKFRNEELYSVGKPMKEVFWLPVDSAWFKIAEELKVKLERCNDTFCLPTTPKVVCGLKGSSADMFLDNAEYRKFLFREFGVSTVDEESAAVVMTTTSPGVPVIVFRGVSDLAGGEPTWSSTSLMNLASINALKVAVEFIATVGKQKSTTLAQSTNN